MQRFILLASFSVVASCLADVELKPHFYTTAFGDASLRRVYFADGDKKFAVTLDQETDVASEGDGALFKFKSIPQASIQFKKSPLPAASGFDPTVLETYTKTAQGMIDATAQEVASEVVGLDVLPFNKWLSYRVNYKYTIAGTPIRQSYTFMNLSPQQQVLIVVTAKEKDFGEVLSRADDIFRRWHRILPGDEKGEN
jgi:hypothetical protein